MKKYSPILAVAFTSLFAAPFLAAGPIFSNALVVGSPTHSATFDSLVPTVGGIDLSDYTEDGLSVTVNDDAYNPAGYLYQTFYGFGGNNHWVTISVVDGSPIYALDFTLGHGWGPWEPGETTNLIWETFNGGLSTGFGDLILDVESTVGWTDIGGFDSLRVAAHYQGINAFGEYQGIMIDDLRVSSAPQAVPAASSTLGLGFLGLGLLVFSRRR